MFSTLCSIPLHAAVSLWDCLLITWLHLNAPRSKERHGNALQCYWHINKGPTHVLIRDPHMDVYIKKILQEWSLQFLRIPVLLNYVFLLLFLPFPLLPFSLPAPKLCSKPIGCLGRKTYYMESVVVLPLVLNKNSKCNLHLCGLKESQVTCCSRISCLHWSCCSAVLAWHFSNSKIIQKIRFAFFACLFSTTYIFYICMFV